MVLSKLSSSLSRAMQPSATLRLGLGRGKLPASFFQLRACSTNGPSKDEIDRVNQSLIELNKTIDALRKDLNNNASNLSKEFQRKGITIGGSGLGFLGFVYGLFIYENYIKEKK